MFGAVDRLIAREGPNAISSRAITDEAGCAKGVLPNHFGDVDRFLTAYMLDRARRLTEQVQALRERAGSRTVVENLTTAGVSLFGSGAAALTALMAARPSLQARLRGAGSPVTSVFDEIQRAIGVYLADEQALGRLSRTGVDVDMVAFALVGALHHLFFIHGLEPADARDVQRVVEAVLVGQTARADFQEDTPAG